MIGFGLNIANRVMGGGGGGSAFDVDAQAFFDRVETAGGTLTTTEKNATNQLVLDMKTAGIWSSMKAIYPMVGASAAACAQNLKSSSFTGTFTSGWTFASTGVAGNGTSAFFNTNFNTATNQSVNNLSLSLYIRTESMGTGFRTDMGNNDSANALPLTNFESNGTIRYQYCWDYSSAFGSITTTDSRGMWGTSRSGATSWISFERNTAVAKTTATTQIRIPNNNVYLGAQNASGTASQFSSKQIAFAHMGDSLTSTQYNNFYTAVQSFQTTLSRQV
jgi:hypothetical protein